MEFGWQNSHGWHFSREDIEIMWFIESLTPQKIQIVNTLSEDNKNQHLKNIERNSFFKYSVWIEYKIAIKNTCLFNFYNNTEKLFI